MDETRRGVKEPIIFIMSELGFMADELLSSFFFFIFLSLEAMKRVSTSLPLKEDIMSLILVFRLQ